MVGTDDGTVLVVGNQRSYSDVCVNRTVMRADSGIITCARSIGIVRCRAGTTIYQLIHATGCRPPVVPGTGWATVGGCIANDVHGKNHRADGTFGHHVRAINLNGERLLPSDSKFAATVGGLGLTGKIVTADIKLVLCDPFVLPWLFPLDYIPGYWPLYKSLRLWQYHCVVPAQALKHIRKIVGNRSLLTVHKRFDDYRPSVGMLSFCRPGISVCMDFAPKHKPLMLELDMVVTEFGGAVYPAKTSMSGAMFKLSFPRWREFSRHVHPAYSSDFWRRVSA